MSSLLAVLLVGCAVLTQADPGDSLSCPTARAHPTRLKLDEERAKAAHHHIAKVMHPGRRGTAFDPKFAGSQCHQDAVLVDIFDAIGTKSRFFVEWGSRRPNILNSAHFRKHCDWCGLLLDGSPGSSPNGGSMHYPEVLELLNASNSSCSRLRQAFITPDNVNAVLARHHVPAEIDLLTVDMDGQDYWVISAFDFARIRPRVIAVEFSSHFNSHEMCTTRRDAAYVWNFLTDEEVGSSLALLDGLLSCRGYQYVTQIAGEHGIWVHRSVLAAEDVAQPARIPERVHEGRGFAAPRRTGHLKDIVCNVELPVECLQPPLVAERRPPMAELAAISHRSARGLQLRRSWVEVDGALLRQHARKLLHEISGARWCAVIKGNGYGLGTLVAARAATAAGAAMLCVDYLQTAVELRQAGLELPMLVLYDANPDAACLAQQHGVTLSIVDHDQVRRLRAALDGCAPATTHAQIDVHIAVDVSMMREGVLPTAVEATAAALAGATGVRVTGVWMHFACMEEKRVRDDLRRFAQVVGQVMRTMGNLSRALLTVHAANVRSVVAKQRHAYLDMVRTLHGTMMMHGETWDPTLAVWNVRILLVKASPADNSAAFYSVGYSCKPARSNLTVAVLPVGYHEYPRWLSPRGSSNFATHVSSGARLQLLTAAMSESIFEVPPHLSHAVKAGDLVTITFRSAAQLQALSGEVPRILQSSPSPELLSVGADHPGERHQSVVALKRASVSPAVPALADGVTTHSSELKQCDNNRRALPNCTTCVLGLVGENCMVSHTTRSMRAKMIRGYNHKHPEHKDMSCAIFPHLHSPQLRVRLPMVAWWMQINAPRRILEIGPSSNPIYPHLEHCPDEVVIVEPCGELALPSIASSKLAIPNAGSGGASGGEPRSWTSERVPCPGTAGAEGRTFVLTVVPLLFQPFFALQHDFVFDAVVCLGCNAALTKGPRREEFLTQVRRPFDLYLEIPAGIKESLSEFALRTEDDAKSAAAFTAAGCRLQSVSELSFPEIMAANPGYSTRRVLQYARCA